MSITWVPHCSNFVTFFSFHSSLKHIFHSLSFYRWLNTEIHSLEVTLSCREWEERKKREESERKNKNDENESGIYFDSLQVIFMIHSKLRTFSLSHYLCVLCNESAKGWGWYLYRMEKLLFERWIEKWKERLEEKRRNWRKRKKSRNGRKKKRCCFFSCYISEWTQV